ncbi:MAG: YXWGXW repeat-containing protein [Burkholderiales bacterium]
MNLKKRLIVATVASAAGALSAPALAQVGISVNIGAPVVPPPAVVYEAPSPPPATGYVWAPGYWGWQHDRYIWVRGRYVYGRPGYVWRPDRWEQHGSHWQHVAGNWEREGHHGNGHGHR